MNCVKKAEAWPKFLSISCKQDNINNYGNTGPSLIFPYPIGNINRSHRTSPILEVPPTSNVINRLVTIISGFSSNSFPHEIHPEVLFSYKFYVTQSAPYLLYREKSQYSDPLTKSPALSTGSVLTCACACVTLIWRMPL